MTHSAHAEIVRPAVCDVDSGSEVGADQVIGLAAESVWLRASDLVVSGAGLLLLSPLLAIAIAAIKLDSPGPAIIRQERVGKGGRHFQMVKLRTMVRDAEADGRPVWSLPGDPRVTRVGGFLRRSHLDEVPQLWNVLQGEMSLVGPRPERPQLAELLAESLPAYQWRHIVRPGITGWAQVQLSYSASITDAERKLAYDLYYIQHRSVRLDARIWLRTLGIAVGLCRL